MRIVKHDTAWKVPSGNSAQPVEQRVVCGDAETLAGLEQIVVELPFDANRIWDSKPISFSSSLGYQVDRRADINYVLHALIHEALGNQQTYDRLPGACVERDENVGLSSCGMPLNECTGLAAPKIVGGTL